MSRIAPCVRLLAILLGSLWLGYSIGYTAAMHEVRDAQGESGQVVQLVRDRDGLFYVHGDPTLVNQVVRYWWEHEQARAVAPP